MLLGEYMSPEHQEKRATGKWLVVCTAQTGATEDTFDGTRFEHEVLAPLQKLLESGSTDFIALSVPVNPECQGAEGFKLLPLDDGPPYHRISLSILSMLEKWKGKDLLDRVKFMSDTCSRSVEELLRKTLEEVPERAKLIRTVNLGEAIPHVL
jgi:hypothetical protein